MSSQSSLLNSQQSIIYEQRRVTNDLLWCLYGFIKNLPETGEMIHGFVEYSLGNLTSVQWADCHGYFTLTLQFITGMS